MSFSNQLVTAPVPGKPHITKMNGYWYIIDFTSSMRESMSDDVQWFVTRLNERLLWLEECKRNNINPKGWFKNGCS